MFFPQLDTIRAIAVGSVLLHHWASRIEYGLDLGRFGVFLFFVLSGFLITGILLDAKAKQIPFSHLLKQFYLRRIVRILPLFYFVVISAALLNLAGARTGFWWHFFYLSNVRLFLDSHVWGPTDHFWSLAVEEQFYLVWPVLILCLNRKWIPHLVAVLVIVANVYRIRHAGSVLHDYATPAVLDALAVGALLSHIQRDNSGLWHNRKLPPILALAGTVALATRWHPLYSAACTFFAASLVILAARGLKGKVGMIMDNGFLRYIGRISYGIYVYHGLTPVLLEKFTGIPRLHLALRFTLWTTVTVVIAAISWKYFERPINDLKRFFPYAEKSRPRPVQAISQVGAQQ